MSPFWATVFSELRERGRQPHIFIIALAVLFVLLAFGAMLKDIVGRDNFNNYIGPVLCVLFLLWLVWVVTKICRAIFSKPERIKFPRLSSDERAKARSKLRNNTSPPRRPPARAPDTDLKY